MADGLIAPENLSKEFLKAILDAAFVDASFDGDGDLMVKEQVRCYVLLDDSKERIRLLAQFRFLESATPGQRLECANQINSQYIIARAIVGPGNALRFTWDIPVAGGITRKAFVLALKRFCTIPHEAIGACAGNLIA